VPPALTRFARLERLLANRVPTIVEEKDRSRAAVAVVVVPDPDAILLIRRAERAGDRWSGQMAFPGGRWSAGDVDLLATARRETLEEVGIDLGEARVLGRLDDLAPRTVTLPAIVVTPFVFELDRRFPVIANHEVAATVWEPLEQFTAPGTYRPYELELGGATVRFPGYHLGTGTVWGMTERILTPLLGMLGSSPAGPG
jgi:8-oxo-dGTP pyrophosphatase MutT (NUDIX family)